MTNDISSRYDVKDELVFMGARLRRIRRNLDLTQQRATLLFGGDRNSISRYEQGRTKPPHAYVVLMLLLEKHPEQLAVIESLKVRG